MTDSPDNSPPQIDIPEDDFHAARAPRDLRGRLNLRMEEMMERELRDVAEDPRYPLNTISEVGRFCLLLGMQRLLEWQPRKTMLGSMRAASAVIERDRMQAEAMDLIDRMDERIHWYVEQGEYDEAICLVAEIRSYFDGLIEDFWRRHIVETIDKRFEDWLQLIDRERNDTSRNQNSSRR